MREGTASGVALAVVAGAIVLAAAAVALVPVRFCLRARCMSCGDLSWSAEADWGWGIVRLRAQRAETPSLTVLGWRMRIPRLPKRNRRRPVRPARLRRASPRLLPRVAATLHLRLGGRLRVGCGEPALTAAVAVLAALGLPLAPDFVTAGCDGDLSLRGWCVPAAPALAAMR